MKGLLFFALTALLLVTTSCSNEKEAKLFIDQHVKQVVFFSDSSNYNNEASYYDAIIELKQNFPNEIKNMKIVNPTDTKKYFKAFDIDDCPAIVVVYEEETLVKVVGDVSKEHIIEPMAKALAQ